MLKEFLFFHSLFTHFSNSIHLNLKGMVLGLSKSRWHIPVQLIGVALVVIGFVLGHAHEGREFSADNVHRSFASTVVLTLAFQVFLGFYLKLHLEKGPNRWFRPFSVKAHKVVGIM